MGGGGMGALEKGEKHVVMIECKGKVTSEKAAMFTRDLHKLIKKYRAKITFDLTGQA